VPIFVGMANLCTRCGHPPHEHRQGRCVARIVGDGGLTIGRCSCVGYSVEPGSRPLAPPEPVDVRLRVSPR
jgi:hypothetical protein